MDIVFLNQVSGKTPNNMEYGVNIINDIDGCIQSSNAGPDCLLYPYPSTALVRHDNMQDPAVKIVKTGHSPIFTTNKQRQSYRYGSGKRKTKQDCKMKQGVRVMNKKPKWKIKGNIPSSVAVVNNSNGSDLSCHDVSHLPQWLHRKYFVPSPTNTIKRSILQRVYVLSAEKN